MARSPHNAYLRRNEANQYLKNDYRNNRSGLLGKQEWDIEARFIRTDFPIYSWRARVFSPGDFVQNTMRAPLSLSSVEGKAQPKTRTVRFHFRTKANAPFEPRDFKENSTYMIVFHIMFPFQHWKTNSSINIDNVAVYRKRLEYQELLCNR